MALAALYAGFRFWNSARLPIEKSQNAMLAKRVDVNGTVPSPSVSQPTVRRDAAIAQLAILVFKSEKRMEVWACRAEKWSLLREYPVLAASGGAGPKLIEGDRQVPEGVYRVVEMNPHSRFHLSMKLDYPNAFDKMKAVADGRTRLGGDICIHGKNCSIGCVAIGDPAIEDLYALVERTGPASVKIIIAPNDLREHIPVKNPYLKLTWLGELYEMIGQELKPYK